MSGDQFNLRATCPEDEYVAIQYTCISQIFFNVAADISHKTSNINPEEQKSINTKPIKNDPLETMNVGKPSIQQMLTEIFH